MKIFILTIMLVTLTAAAAGAETYRRPFPFDRHGCVRHLKAIAKAVKDAGGEVEKNDGSQMSYKMTLNGIITIYTCTRNELLETEL